MARKVLLLITDLEIGGTPTVVRELAVRLRGRGHDVEVACLAPWGPVADQLTERGVHVEGLGARGPADFIGVTRRLVKLIRRRGYDTVFSFLIHANTVAAAAKVFCRGVRFFQSIQTTQPEPRWHWRVQGFVKRAAERIVVPSASVAEAATARSGIPTEKIDVIPNAIDPAEFEGVGKDFTGSTLFPIGFIGRLDPVKRVPVLVGAVLILRHMGVNVHLHIYGDGTERGRIEEEVRRLDMTGSVTLHGTVRRPQEALANVGAVVLPSIAEGFGLVLIEGMAAGVPVVGTNVSGIRDVIRDGENGLLVSPAMGMGDTMRIRSLIEDVDLRQRLIDGGKRTVRERYSWDSVLPQYERALHLVS